MSRKKIDENVEKKKTPREISNEVGTKNLIPFNRRTEEERKRISSKAGKASVKARREAKSMKTMLKNVLEMPNTDERAGISMEKNGFDRSDNIHMAKIIIALTQKAEDGDLKAIELINKFMYGEESNVNVNMSGELETTSRVQIYLPERDEPVEE